MFRPVPSIGEWVFCLLLLWDGDAGVRDRGKMCVCYVELVCSLNGSSGELAGRSSFLDEEEIEECNKQNKGGERFKHES